MDFNIGKTNVYGLEFAVKASGNPMRTALDRSETNEKDILFLIDTLNKHTTKQYS